MACLWCEIVVVVGGIVAVVFPHSTQRARYQSRWRGVTTGCRSWNGQVSFFAPQCRRRPVGEGTEESGLGGGGRTCVRACL